MRVVIIGATGRTGQQVTEQALIRGHSVTAVVRSVSAESKEGLKTVVADPCKAEALTAALSEQDAVISCLGHRPGGNLWLVRDAAVATLQAMQQNGVKRFVIVSGALLYPTLNPVALLLKRLMAVKLTDGRAAEDVITQSDTGWTIVRPPRLLNGTVSKGYSIVAGPKPSLTWSLQFRDLAACLLDLSEGASHVGQIVGVASL